MAEYIPDTTSDVRNRVSVSYVIPPALLNNNTGKEVGNG